MTYWHRDGITYTVEPCSDQNWGSSCKGSSATCLNSPLLHSKTSPLKVTDVVMDFHASCKGGYPPPDGPWTKEPTADQGPCEAEAERRHQWCAAVGKKKQKQKQEKQVFNVQMGFLYATHSKQFASLLHSSSPVSHFGDPSLSTAQQWNNEKSRKVADWEKDCLCWV